MNTKHTNPKDTIGSGKVPPSPREWPVTPPLVGYREEDLAPVVMQIAGPVMVVQHGGSR